MQHPVTPDGRYFVVKDRLWRATNPQLGAEERERLVKELMKARRAVRDALHGKGNLAEARSRVQSMKVALGERGPVWWSDGAPDYNRQMVSRTPYAAWFTAVAEVLDEEGGSGPESLLPEP